MVVDTSAVLAILGDEPERHEFIQLIAGAAVVRMSVANYVEAGVVQRVRRGPAGVHEFVAFVIRSGIELVSVDSEQATRALDGYGSFGKGGHPAGLNYGDCFAYALAAATGEPLLFKGRDFSQTDITPAWRD